MSSAAGERSSTAAPESVCPYAASNIHSDDDDETRSASSAHTPPASSPVLTSSTTTSAAEALALAKSSCPAFRGGSTCPFRDVKDADGLRRTMMTVPKSHDEEGKISVPFRAALGHVHNVGLTLQHSHATKAASAGADADAAPPVEGEGGEEEKRRRRRSSADFLLEGGCPFKTYYRRDDGKGVPFVNAMEGFSLGAIMGRMADLHHEEEEEERKDDDDRDVAATGGEAILGGESIAVGRIPPDDDDDDDDRERPSVSKKKRPSLAHALKTGTAESHEAAENVHFVRDFIRGKIDRTLYGMLLTDLYHVYSALEDELNVHGPVEFPTLHRPEELARVEALEDDMDFFHGSDWKRLEPSQSASEYIDRVRHIAKTEPLLLLSHGYTRYLGDLSGGRILARVARKALKLSKDGDGLRFYMFENVTSAKKFKDGYRAALDDLDLAPDQIGRLVGEANVAFVLNMRIFEELDVKGGVEGAKVRELSDAVGYFDRVVEEQRRRRERGENEAEEAKCPFGFVDGPSPHGPKKESSAAERRATGEERTGVRFSAETTTTAATKRRAEGGRCPWPFVFFHDPWLGMKDFQTWIVAGLVLCWAWTYLQTSSRQ